MPDEKVVTVTLSRENLQRVIRALTAHREATDRLASEFEQHYGTVEAVKMLREESFATRDLRNALNVARDQFDRLQRD